MALDSGAAQVQCVGVGGGRGDGGGHGAGGSAGRRRDRVNRREGAAAAFDDDQEAAVAAGGEVGQRRIRTGIDRGRQSPRDGVAALAERDAMADGDAVHDDLVEVARDRRAGQGGEGCGRGRGCRSPGRRRHCFRREGRGDQRAGRTGDDDPGAFGRGAEPACAGSNVDRQRLGDLGQRVHDDLAAAKVLRGADEDRVIRAAQGHAPEISGHRRAAQVDREGCRRGGSREGTRGRDRQGRRETQARLLDDDEAGALRRRGVTGQTGVGADGCGKRFGDLGQGIDGAGDGDVVVEPGNGDPPDFIGRRRPAQAEGNGREGCRSRAYRCRCRRRRSDRGDRSAGGEAAGRALDDEQRIAFGNGREVRKTRMCVDAVGEDRGQGLHAVGNDRRAANRVTRADLERCRDSGDRQCPVFARHRRTAKADFCGRCGGRVGHREIADCKGIAGAVDNDHQRAIRGRGVVRQRVGDLRGQEVDPRGQAGGDFGGRLGARGGVGDGCRGRAGGDHQRRRRGVNQPGADRDQRRHGRRRIHSCGGVARDLERGGEQRAIAIHDD